MEGMQTAQSFNRIYVGSMTSMFVICEGKKMEQLHFMISDAAKKVEVETHVLRYWEEELEIPIQRNELGHRYYSQEDIERFVRIKKLKEQGFQLKAIRLILVNGNLNRIGDDGKIITMSQGIQKVEGKKEEKEGMQLLHRDKKTVEKKVVEEQESSLQILEESKIQSMGGEESKQEKALRLQILLKQMISEAVRENNQELADDIKSSVLKELDYQFRLQEEREEEREKGRTEREEEHYRKLDELLRSRMSSRGKRRKHSGF